MARAVAQRSPDDRDLALAEQVAGILQVDEVLQLEGHVVHFDVVAADEIHRVMVGVAAHEHEKIVDPVGHLKAEHLLVEFSGLLRVVDHPGDVAEFQRADAIVLQVLAEIAPFLEQRDGGALVVLEGEDLADAGRDVYKRQVLLQACRTSDLIRLDASQTDPIPI